MTSVSCWNVSHQQQFFLELPSPGRSLNTNLSITVANKNNAKRIFDLMVCGLCSYSFKISERVWISAWSIPNMIKSVQFRSISSLLYYLCKNLWQKEEQEKRYKWFKTKDECPHLRPFSYFPFWTISQVTDCFVNRFGRRITAGSLPIAYNHTVLDSFATSCWTLEI